MTRATFHQAAWVSAWLMLAMSAPCAWALSVSPARTDVRLEPGEVKEVILTVANPHPMTYQVELSEKPWFKYEENKSIKVKDWLKLPKKTAFRLKSGKSKAITIKVECPKDAVGELMGMVSIASQEEAGSMLTSMISTPIYLRVIGKEVNTGEIVAFGAGTRGNQFQIGVQVKATGNVRLRPTGQIALFDEIGQIIAEYLILEGSPIFPGQTHDLAGQGPTELPPVGRYTAKVALKSDGLELTAQKVLVIRKNGDVVIEK